MTEFANGMTAAKPSSFYNSNFTSSGAVRVNYYSVGTYAQDQWKVNQKLNSTRGPQPEGGDDGNAVHSDRSSTR